MAKKKKARKSKATPNVPNMPNMSTPHMSKSDMKKAMGKSWGRMMGN